MKCFIFKPSGLIANSVLLPVSTLARKCPGLWDAINPGHLHIICGIQAFLHTVWYCVYVIMSWRLKCWVWWLPVNMKLFNLLFIVSDLSTVWKGRNSFFRSYMAQIVPPSPTLSSVVSDLLLSDTKMFAKNIRFEWLRVKSLTTESQV